MNDYVPKTEYLKLQRENKALKRQVENVVDRSNGTVKQGIWIISCDGYYPYCNQCGYEPERPCIHDDNRTPFCPNCGSPMKKECGD